MVLANMLTGLGIDEFFTRTDVPAGVTSFFLSDSLGSAVGLSNTAGTIQTEFTYEPFGKTSATGASNASSYQYTGRENDGTGLYYYRARFYHPTFQRFISEDPVSLDGTILMAQMWSEFGALFGEILRDPQQQNPYTYVVNNPMLYTDPEGELWGPVMQRILAWLALGGMLGESIGPAIACFFTGHCEPHDSNPHPENEPYMPPNPKDQGPNEPNPNPPENPPKYQGPKPNPPRPPRPVRPPYRR